MIVFETDMKEMPISCGRCKIALICFKAKMDVMPKDCPLREMLSREQTREILIYYNMGCEDDIDEALDKLGYNKEVEKNNPLPTPIGADERTTNEGVETT